MGYLIKKAFITDTEQNAVDFVAKFEENVTSYSYNGSQYMVIVRMVDGHILTQLERDSLVDIPEDFYSE